VKFYEPAAGDKWHLDNEPDCWGIKAGHNATAPNAYDEHPVVEHDRDPLSDDFSAAKPFCVPCVKRHTLTEIDDRYFLDGAEVGPSLYARLGKEYQ
jgi:hypothetical protein